MIHLIAASDSFQRNMHRFYSPFKVNKFDFSPIQIAAIKCHKSCLVTLIKYGDSDSLLALSSCKETLLHLGRICEMELCFDRSFPIFWLDYS